MRINTILRLLVVGSLCYPIDAVCQTGKETPLTGEKVRTIVRKSIERKDVALSVPTLRESDGRLLYNFYISPRAENEMITEGYKRRPLEYPIDAQIVVESVRFSLGKKQSFEWEPYLWRIEKLVDEQVGLIGKDKDEKRMLEKLADYDRDIMEIYAEAAEKLAKSKNLKATPVFEKGATGFEVKFTTKPEGGTIYFVTVFQYACLTADGRGDKIQEWHEIRQETQYMGGNYYFFVRWPDGKKRDTGKVTIANDKPIVFAPE